MMTKRKIRQIAALAALMGLCFTAGVYADGTIQQVTAYLRSDYHVVVDGKELKLENPPLIYHDRSYLPLKEITDSLGANVNWQGDTNTIFINSRINPQQSQNNQDLSYDVITMTAPVAFYVQYLGVKYPVLMLQAAVNGKVDMFYRIDDVLKMGIDVNGLKKAKEKCTGWLFVSQSELQKSWKAKFATVYRKGIGVVTGEEDPQKLAALQNHLQSMSRYMIGSVTILTTPIILDVAGDNQYNCLLYQNGKLSQEQIKLTATGDGSYTVSSYNLQMLQP